MMAETMRSKLYHRTQNHNDAHHRRVNRRRVQNSGAAPVWMITAIYGVQGISEERTTVCGAMPVRKEE